MATLDTRIELGVNTEALQAFAGEIAVETEGLSDLDLASAIIDKIDALPDAEWEAMTMALKTWSNQINSAKQNLIEEDKKAAIAAKALKTKSENSSGAPTTPAAIKKAIEACTTKPKIEELSSDIARACGCGVPDFKKSWTIAKYKEFALANLKKVKDAAPEETTDQPVARKTAKADPAASTGKTIKRNAQAPTEGEVVAAKKTAKTVADGKTAKKSSGKIIEGEFGKRGTTGWLVWNVLKKSKKKTGLTLAEIKEQFIADFKESGLTSSNPEGRVTRIMAELKKTGIATRLETGNYILTEHIQK